MTTQQTMFGLGNAPRAHRSDEPVPPGDAAPTGRRRTGRPRDPQATGRIIAATQDVLASDGCSVTVEAITVRGGVGKATIYRRWPHVPDLMVDAVTATDPFAAAPAPDGDTRTQLLAVLGQLAHPLSPHECTAVVALHHAAWDERLRQAAEDVLLNPLRDRVAAACRSGSTPEPPAERVEALLTVVEALWVRRWSTRSVQDPAQVELLVDDVLLPLLRP
ncbi:TetR/AcrR family transcriptional regulator [Klenkia brasiliensis]|uniref:DNA-binding transcriptional regulator, AcrR family n=1 Tax=Klenkia brasiliensis TaxID=333142 RepID=A0A1G7Q5H6_9ACTN|nr:hypothetical protein [Klenkia brasiliensis]SDF93802.1 DNA-binding transcriptional regulator, AcrR family [Klenkia brasiliensis]